ncbi:MAG TPA: ferredoxin [Actinocrinis sp.]|nr:ferredoxin [Actinocrinis sp.]
MHVEIDQDKCCGSGLCALTAPEVFDQRDEDGIGYVLDPAPTDDEVQTRVFDAEKMCPASAVSVTENR